MKKILPGLHTFTGLLVGRSYAIEDPDGLTIIDTSLSFAPQRILKQIAELGYKPEDIKRILITHAHPDHIGGLRELQSITGAAVYVSEGERAVVEDEAPIPGPPLEKLPRLLRRMSTRRATFKPTPVARVLHDGDVLDEVMDGLQVIATPGHAPGHVAFWQPKLRVLFCGDVMMSLWRNRLQLPFRFVTVDMDQDICSIRRIADLDARVLCLGHGVPVKHNTASLIRAFAQKVSAN
jgi:glyoxylase-like metal-dependent hydrolase (beta-lactamase superfamily II)